MILQSHGRYALRSAANNPALNVVHIHRRRRRDFALNRLTQVIDRLVVYPDAMKRNLDRLGGLIHSQRVMLALTQKGMSREDAYQAVQRNAMPAWRDEMSFRELLEDDPDVSARLSSAELDELFDLAYHTKHVDTIFARVFGAG